MNLLKRYRLPRKRKINVFFSNLLLKTLPPMCSLDTYCWNLKSQISEIFGIFLETLLMCCRIQKENKWFLTLWKFWNSKNVRLRSSLPDIAESCSYLFEKREDFQILNSKLSLQFFRKLQLCFLIFLKILHSAYRQNLIFFRLNVFSRNLLLKFATYYSKYASKEHVDFPFSWESIPFIYFFNDQLEVPLLNKCKKKKKCLQGEEKPYL